MTQTWVDLVNNSEKLTALYSNIPPLTSVRLRSVNFNWRGPSVIFRMDLPSFPDKTPPASETSHDTLQIHLQFLAVDNLTMNSWTPPALSDISFTPTKNHRVSVSCTGPGCALAFNSSDSLLVGHMSTFAIAEDGSDTGSRNFLGRVDARRFTTLPPADEKTFYERL
ncbi:Imm50 family immunity protein [Streptomyces sp. NPDC088116]|uniref:Imm50 family immunity protein n=1 Tax=Streptomyces sp. NPDC088116 TaxID=3365825 RepID=UPI0038213744